MKRTETNQQREDAQIDPDSPNGGDYSGNGAPMSIGVRVSEKNTFLDVQTVEGDPRAGGSALPKAMSAPSPSALGVAGVSAGVRGLGLKPIEEEPGSHGDISGQASNDQEHAQQGVSSVVLNSTDMGRASGSFATRYD